MAGPGVESLVLELLEWLLNGERTYEEAMSAWRTSCPRLPVWEEARDRGLITSERTTGMERVRVAPLGIALLNQRKRFRKPGL